MGTRVNGIISGLDTESLVKAAVMYQQQQIDRLGQKTTKLKWQREAYTSIYDKIKTFRESTLFQYKLNSTTNVKSTKNSDESIVTAKANSDAVTGVHTLKVHKLAVNAQTGSSAAIGSRNDKTNLASQLGETFSGGAFTININGKDISVDPTTQTMNDFIKAINNSGAGVTASYDSNVDRIFLKSDKAGEEGVIDLTAASNTVSGSNAEKLLGKLNLSTATKVEGEDAVFDLDGVTGITQAGNEFTIAGISYSLKKADPSTTVSINVASDSDGILESVKSFVNSYNELLKGVNSVLYEQKYSGYTPLTDDQKESMTADEITKWEEKAKSGVLRTDSLLMNITSGMRQTIYSSVKGIDSVTRASDGKTVTYNSLFAIGIKTGGYSSNGELEIDEDKLKEAIENDPEAITKIFTGSTDAKGNATEGVADILYDQLKIQLDKINDKAGSATGDNDISSRLSKEITRLTDDMNKKITRMNARMQTLYKQYDAMESLLQQLQQQQDSLSNYFGSSS